MTTIRCLKTVVKSGSRRYPLFVGFLKAAEVAEVAEAPSFSKKTSHRDIATNVLSPPVKGWQRPLDKERVATIKRVFRDDGALMPNPVLLSENGENPAGAVEIEAEKASGSILSNVWVVKIKNLTDGSKPLWVLDGQHRISGLAQSKQKENEIPIVLLLNDSGESDQSYNGRDFAHLFAQVTTTAKKLDELHNEWLTYAYELDDYSSENADFQEHRNAMKTVAELCRIPELTSDEPNPFLNNVRFNPELSSPSKESAFVYGCRQLKELIRKHYFARASNPLAPDELANQLGIASRALKSVVSGPQDESVFFGRPGHAQLPMQDAFVIGALIALQHQDPSSDWELFLKGLNFHQTDWRFKKWVKTTGGKAGTDSRNVAERVMGRVFREGELPDGVEDLADYLRGNWAQVQVAFSRLSDKGRPMKTGRHTIDLKRGEDRSFEADDRLHIKIPGDWKQSNIARLNVVDATSNIANPKKIPNILGRGFVLDREAEEPELILAVYMHFYGGQGAEVKLTVRW